MSKARVWDGFSSKVSSVSSIFSSHFHLSSALCRRPGCHYSKLFSRQVRGCDKKRGRGKKKRKKGAVAKKGRPTKKRSQGKNKLAKPRSYASLKLRLTDSLTYLLTRVKCRATSVAKKQFQFNSEIKGQIPVVFLCSPLIHFDGFFQKLDSTTVEVTFINSSAKVVLHLCDFSPLCVLKCLLKLWTVRIQVTFLFLIHHFSNSLIGFCQNLKSSHFLIYQFFSEKWF